MAEVSENQYPHAPQAIHMALASAMVVVLVDILPVLLPAGRIVPQVSPIIQLGAQSLAPTAEELARCHALVVSTAWVFNTPLVLPVSLIPLATSVHTMAAALLA